MTEPARYECLPNNRPDWSGLTSLYPTQPVVNPPAGLFPTGWGLGWSRVRSRFLELHEKSRSDPNWGDSPNSHIWAVQMRPVTGMPRGSVRSRFLRVSWKIEI